MAEVMLGEELHPDRVVQIEKLYEIMNEYGIPYSFPAQHGIESNAFAVVRCKGCTNFEEQYRIVGEAGKVYCGGYCYHWDYEQGMSPNQVDGDDFCSYGERRTE